MVAVFAFREWSPRCTLDELIERDAGPLAALLLAETTLVSGHQVRDALASRLSYAPDDMAVAHWNGAILFDRIFEKIMHHQTTRRMELLEIIIIVLIMVEVIRAFIS